MKAFDRQVAASLLRGALAAAALATGMGDRPAMAAGPTEITSCTTITEPGSYVVVNNLTPAAPGDCLVIAAHFVTIDLNGFVVTGAPARPKVGIGIGTPANTGKRGVSIHDGTVVDFFNGVSVQSEDVRIERVRSVGNDGIGIYVFSCGSCAPSIVGTGLIKDCAVSHNGGGIVATNAVITGNSAFKNQDTGISAIGSTITANVSNGNGTYGIVVGCPSAVVANTARGNGIANLSLGANSCTAAHNAAP